MAGRLTDRKKKKIVADYLELRSVNAAAKRNNVSWKKANEAIQEDKELTKKLEDKKAENTADILAYMESQREVVCEIIGKGLDALNDPKKLAEASPAQITTALGTLIDKFTALYPARPKDSADTMTLEEKMAAIREAARTIDH